MTHAPENDPYLAKLDAAAENDPVGMLTPIDQEVAAAILDTTPKGLEQWRHRAKNGGPEAPPGWAYIPGLGWRYPSRYALIRWMHEQHLKARGLAVAS